MKTKDRILSDHRQNSLTALAVFSVVFIISISGCRTQKASETFLEIKQKFPSNTQSIKVSDAEIDYDGRLKVLFNDGTLYRRLDSLGCDYYFLGRGRIIVTDTSGLTVAGREKFEKQKTLDFVSAYLCGDRFPVLLGLDPGGWHEDKIKRPHWNELQFMLKAPDKHFGVNLGAELDIWSEREIFPLPVWIDLKLADESRLAAYLSPDIAEQLHLYAYDAIDETPNLIGGYNLGGRIISRPIEIDSTEIFIELKESGRFDARCKLFFGDDRDNPSYRAGMKLNLPFLFTVDSVKSGGRNQPFYKKKLRGNLYLQRSQDIAAPNSVEVFYRGKYLRSPRVGLDLPVNMTGWFPHLPRRTLGRFILHYALHKDMALLSVGEKVGEKVVGEKKTITYRTGDNISYVSFATGVYDTLTETVHDLPVNLYIRRENNMGLFNRHKPREVMADLAGAFEAFYDRFGPPTSKELDIVDRVAFVGQSSPGLIHLSHISFETKRDQARFRAHEIAHQWWGHTAVPKTVRDMWLSEGLAEYSAGLYLLDHLHDTTAFVELLDFWRRQVLEEGKVNGLYSRGYRAGSILQGMRFLESSSPGDYMALVYAKAACLLRMLRFEIDGPNYRTDFFSAMLSDYLRNFHGKQASSTDFIKIASKYIGSAQAERFFRHWLYGWKIPAFEAEYTVLTDDRGRQSLALEINVSGMDNGFETPFPVEIEFADGNRRLFRIDGIGLRNTHQLGPFPQKVSHVRFDPGHIILSRSVEVHKKQ
ncbi:MAG: M1 family metallopeptidase [FCB group bacterium]|nr:M1 family metallopeptidase [FCB group bacterium]